MTRIKQDVAVLYPKCKDCGAPLTHRGNKHLVYACGNTLNVRRMVWDGRCTRQLDVLTDKIIQLTKQLKEAQGG